MQLRGTAPSGSASAFLAARPSGSLLPAAPNGSRPLLPAEDPSGACRPGAEGKAGPKTTVVRTTKPRNASPRTPSEAPKERTKGTTSVVRLRAANANASWHHHNRRSISVVRKERIGIPDSSLADEIVCREGVQLQVQAATCRKDLFHGAKQFRKLPAVRLSRAASTASAAAGRILRAAWSC